MHTCFVVVLEHAACAVYYFYVCISLNTSFFLSCCVLHCCCSSSSHNPVTIQVLQVRLLLRHDRTRGRRRTLQVKLLHGRKTASRSSSTRMSACLASTAVACNTTGHPQLTRAGSARSCPPSAPPTWCGRSSRCCPCPGPPSSWCPTSSNVSCTPTRQVAHRSLHACSFNQRPPCSLDAREVVQAEGAGTCGLQLAACAPRTNRVPALLPCACALQIRQEWMHPMMNNAFSIPWMTLIVSGGCQAAVVGGW